MTLNSSKKKTLSQRKFKAQDGFTGEFYQIFEKNFISTLHKLLENI